MTNCSHCHWLWILEYLLFALIKVFNFQKTHYIGVCVCVCVCVCNCELVELFEITETEIASFVSWKSIMHVSFSLWLKVKQQIRPREIMLFDLF